MNNSNNIDKIRKIGESDCETLEQKGRTYGDSWKKRGGVGAFMMVARKMDRLENIAREHNYDIFAAVRAGGMLGSDGSMLAEIRDLRCYLLLVEAEMMLEAEAKLTEANILDELEEILRQGSDIMRNGGVPVSAITKVDSETGGVKELVFPEKEIVVGGKPTGVMLGELRVSVTDKKPSRRNSAEQSNPFGFDEEED